MPSPHTFLYSAPVKLIATDLDGTLLGADGQVSERNRAALRMAEAAGVEVVIATGRRHGYALKVIGGIGLRPEALLLSSNGTVVRTLAHTLVERTLLAPEAVALLCGTLGEFRDALVITFDRVTPTGEDPRGTLVVEELAGLHDSIERWMAANEPYMLHLNPIEQAFDAGEMPIQMMLCGGIDRMRRAEAHLLEDSRVVSVEDAVGETRANALIALSRTEYPDRDLSLLDIVPAGCSKGAALLRMAAARNIRAEEVMALGDNWNDLSMLEVAGHPVLMANAPDDLRAHAVAQGWRIATPNHQDGVALAIEAALTVGAAATS